MTNAINATNLSRLTSQLKCCRCTILFCWGLVIAVIEIRVAEQWPEIRCTKPENSTLTLSRKLNYHNVYLYHSTTVVVSVPMCSEAAANLVLAIHFSSCKGIFDLLGHIKPYKTFFLRPNWAENERWQQQQQQPNYQHCTTTGEKMLAEAFQMVERRHAGL